MEKKIVLSACMMVKNEEQNLPRCLESIKNVVDEIIIVDTGSTDRTVEIAESYGAKVYHHPWENDFSKHRNQSISYAQGDWVFIIDADEEFVLKGGEPQHFREMLLCGELEEIVTLSLRFVDIQRDTAVMNSNSHRFFRRGEISYARSIHNKAVWKGNQGFIGDAELHHYGYDLPPEKKEEKFKRTYSLLIKAIEDDEKDHESYFYLSQLLSTKGMYSECLAYSAKYIEVCDEKKLPTHSCVFFTAYRSAFGLEDYELAKKWIMERLRRIRDDEVELDIYYAMVELGSTKLDEIFIEEGATNYLRSFDKLQHEPQLASSFIFSYHFSALSHVLFCLSTIRITQLNVCLKNFVMAETVTADKEYYSDLKEKLNINLKKGGLPDLKDILLGIED